jgi:hypothetical protein
MTVVTPGLLLLLPFFFFFLLGLGIELRA